MTSQAPFEVAQRGEGFAVVRFREICNVRRTTGHEEQLDALFAETETLVFDLSQTIALSTTWWRYFGTLAQRARREGHRFVIAGASETLVATADAIGVLPMVTVADGVAEALR